MLDSEAYKIIGERVTELTKMPEVQSKMVEMVHNGVTQEDAEKWLYACAIGTLVGING